MRQLLETASSCGLIALWYAGNVFFNVGMKRSHALLPDVMLLTMFQFATGAIALGIYAAAGDAQPSNWWAWRRELACSSLLFFGGTVTTNISLVVLSVSFTHVLKTCEPLFTVIIVYLWDRKMPETSAVLAVCTTVLGVLVASIKQRQSASKGTALGLDVTVALLSNLLLQLRNVYNKRVIIEGKGQSGGCKAFTTAVASETPGLESGRQQSRPMLRPTELLLVNATLAFALQIVLLAVLVTLEAFLVMTRPPSLYEHYGSASKLWLLVPPAAFVLYQIASILVLTKVQPVTHAVLNATKRVIVIGLGAVWMSESISLAFVSGAAVAVVGTLAYSFSKLLTTPTSQRLLQLGLISVALLLVTSACGDGGAAAAGTDEREMRTVKASPSKSLHPTRPASSVQQAAAHGAGLKATNHTATHRVHGLLAAQTVPHLLPSNKLPSNNLPSQLPALTPQSPKQSHVRHPPAARQHGVPGGAPALNKASSPRGTTAKSPAKSPAKSAVPPLVELQVGKELGTDALQRRRRLINVTTPRTTRGREHQKKQPLQQFALFGAKRRVLTPH